MKRHNVLLLLLIQFLFPPKNYAQEPKLILPIGHTLGVTAADFSPDGKRIITSALDNTAKIWEIATGYLLLTLKGDSTEVLSAQYSPDGKRIVTASFDKTAKIWDAETGKILKVIKDSADGIAYAKFSPDGKRMLSQPLRQTPKIWDAETGKFLFELNGEEEYFGFVQYSRDGKNILTLSLDSAVKIWDAETGKFLFEIHKNNDRFGSAQYSPDGKKIVTVSGDFIARVWNAETGKLLPEENMIEKNINYLEYSPDGKNFLIMTGFDYDTVKILDGSSGRLLFYLQEGITQILQSNYSPDGKQILTLLDDNTVKIWDANTGQLLSVARGHAPAIDEIQYSPDGNKIISTGFFDRRKPAWGSVWDVISGKLLQPVKADTATRNINVLYSPDGKKVVTVTTTTTSPPVTDPWPEEVKLWDVTSGNLISTLSGAVSFRVKIIFSPDGKKMVSFSEDNFSSPTIWDTNSGKKLGELPYVFSRTISIQFSRDGKKFLASSFKGFKSSDELKVWDVVTRKILKEWKLSESGLNDAQISPDGKRMFIWLDSTIRIWDFTTFKPLFNLKYSGYVKSIGYSPDGKKIITNNQDGTINLWDANTGKLITNLKGRSRGVTSIEFSPDLKKILTASYYEKVAKVWDAENGNLLNELRGHDDIVSHALFSPDGKSIATASQDNTIKKWDAATGKCLYTFFAVDKNDYLVVDNENRYDGTEAARKLLYFVCGNEIVDLEQVKDQLWVPDLAQRINSGETINAKTLNDLNICGLTPIVEDVSYKENDYHFTIKPRRGGLGETVLSINGIELKRYKSTELKNNTGRYDLIIPKTEVQSFFIPGKENQVTVKAWTADNAISSRGGVVTVVADSSSILPPNLYAVMIGISDYKGDELDLKYAAKDATDISAAVSNAAKKLLNTDGKEHVFMYNLTTEKEHYQLPEKNSIKKTLEEIGKKATANDILLIFFAGHGVTEGEKKQFYFLTADASKVSAADAVADVGISTAELTEWMKPQNIKAQKRILIFDACNSGQAIRDFVKMGNDNQNYLAARNDDKAQQLKVIDKLNEKSGLFILSASASNQSAYEMGRYSQGILTYSLLKAIKQQPDILEDGRYIDVSRWFHAAEKTVSDLSKESGARQDPQIISNTNFNIGIVDDEVMAKIVLPFEKFLFTRSEFRNVKLRVDNLKLRALTDKQLDEVSGSNSSSLIFSPEYDGANVYSISGDYTITGNDINVSVILTKGGTEIKAKFDIKGALNQPDVIAKSIVTTITELLKDKQ